jgi:hypothetical protein
MTGRHYRPLVGTVTAMSGDTALNEEPAPGRAPRSSSRRPELIDRDPVMAELQALGVRSQAPAEVVVRKYPNKIGVEISLGIAYVSNLDDTLLVVPLNR